MKHKKLFVFDIETIPDESVKDTHNEGFLKHPFHKVVAISYLIANISYTDSDQEYYSNIKIGSGKANNEEDLVGGFFDTLENLKPRLISFNGRSFDLPVLKYRAMKYGISAPDFYNAGDKWNNYNQRYSVDWHCDLIETLSDYGASTKPKLNEVCAIFGFPGKIGVDGSQVLPMFNEGRVQEIKDYCETDVLNTYLVYLKYALHIGKICDQSYSESLQEVNNLLVSSELNHWKQFKKAWNDVI